jgi:lipoprotein-anchoring transpeptidase ErfK/SrfK
VQSPRVIGLSLAAVIVPAFIAVFGLAAAGSGQIADGVRVAGVNIGGLSPAPARAKLQRDLSLDRPLRVRYGRRSWQLDPAQALVTLDVRKSVDAALARSREGSVFTRAARHLTGSSLRVDLPARVAYSKLVVERFGERVAAGVNRPVRNATVVPSGQALRKVPQRDGVSVDLPALQRRVGGALGRRGATVRVPVHHLPPTVTVNQLQARYRKYVVVDRSSFRLVYFRDLRPVKSYRISIGQQGLETPAGLYDVQEKTVDPSWVVPNEPWAGDAAGSVIPPGPDDPIKARWLGFNGSAGIHGTDDVGSLGSAASHGCIRMAIPDVIDLYRKVPTHTPVYVV